MRVKLIDPVHVIEQREYSAELLVVLIMGCAGQHRPELVRAHEAERPLGVIGDIFGRGSLHPADLLREFCRCENRRLCDLSGQDQMLLARDDIQDRLVSAVSMAPAHILGIGVVIAGICLSEDRLLRLEVCVHIFDVRFIVAFAHREVQIEQHLGVLDDRFIDLDPEFREGIARLKGAAVVVIDQIQAVLQKLFVAVHARVLELSVCHDKRFDLVKIQIHLLRAQTEIVFEKLLRVAHSQRILQDLKAFFKAGR